MLTIFKNIDLVKEYVFYCFLGICEDILVRGGFDSNTIMLQFENVDSDVNGNSNACCITTGSVKEPKNQFIIYKGIDNDVIRVVMSNINVGDQNAMVDFIVRYDEETMKVSFEFAPIVKPDEKSPDAVSFAWLVGMFSGYLTKVMEDTDLTKFGTDSTDGEE